MVSDPSGSELEGGREEKEFHLRMTWREPLASLLGLSLEPLKHALPGPIAGGRSAVVLLTWTNASLPADIHASCFSPWKYRPPTPLWWEPPHPCWF